MGTRLLDRPRLTRKVQAYLARRPGRTGVMITDLRTDESFGAGKGSLFVTASIVKVNILAGLLLNRQRLHRGLSDGERALASRMIRHSDNRAAGALYAKLGLGRGLDRVNRVFALRRTHAHPTIWGGSTSSPADQVRLLRDLAVEDSPLNAANRRHVLRLMETVVPGQRWGVGAAALTGDRVAIKNGWVPLRNQGHGWAVNSIGRITGHGHDYLVAVCSQGHPTMADGVRTVEHVARTVVAAMRRIDS
ncbi:serine hydrolase [Actinomadura viridis]|uniref:serine hydrolase n=1 Tax=Actinomadura viridis TaxID=58110 RepID=UPI00367BFAD0